MAKILCIDGGGAFGKIPCKILWEANCFDKFDCFVGTSIGSALVAAIALGRHNQFGPLFFDQWMPKVFSKSWWRKFNPLNCKYPDTGLNLALQTVFGNLTLAEAKKPCFLTAANVGTCSLKVFSNQDASDASWLVWEVLRCCCGAESYFPSWKGYSDGGVFANNPSMVAVAACAKVLKWKVEELEVLSLGCGDSSANITAPRYESLYGWGPWLVKALLDGASDRMHTYFAQSMPLKKYERYQFVRKAGWRMDNFEDVKSAERLWAADIKRVTEAVARF